MMLEILVNIAFYAPVLIAIVIGWLVFGWQRRTNERFRGAFALRLISAGSSALIMSLIGIAIAVLFICWASSSSAGNTKDTGTFFGIFVLLIDIAASVVIAALVGTGIGRSADGPGHG